jgi:serine/threonine protein kinase
LDGSRGITENLYLLIFCFMHILLPFLYITYYATHTQVIKNSNGCNLAVDIWSLGCTVLEMATSKPPWSQYEGIAAMFKIGNSKELPPIPDHLSEPGKDFIRKCLQRDPSQRPTAMELLQHPFVQKAVSLEKSVLSEPLEHLAVISCRSSAKVPLEYCHN